MSANTLSALVGQHWRPLVQEFLNNILVGREICNTKVEADLDDGDTVNFPQMSDLRDQDYVQGTDLVIDPLTSSQSSLTVNQSKAVTMAIDPVQEKQASSKYVATMAQQAAFRLANRIDKKLLGDGVTAANNTIAGGTVSTSTMFDLFTQARAQLFRNNALDGETFSVIDAKRAGLLAQTFISGGFNLADKFLENSYVGEAHGFKVYISNNLPSRVSLTLATNPTTNDTITIYGVTWTFVANGTAANAGEISIGGNAAATQAIVVNAINGTGTPGASTYIELSTTNRRTYQNNDVLAGAFNANVSVITAVGLIGASSSLIAGAPDGFGTETTQMLFGRQGAISLGMQMLPTLLITQEPKQLAKNYITHTLFGTKVFSRDAFKLVKVTHNA